MEALKAIRPVGASSGESLFRLSDDKIARSGTAAAEAAGLCEGFTGHFARVGMGSGLGTRRNRTPCIDDCGGDGIRRRCPRDITVLSRLGVVRLRDSTARTERANSSFAAKIESGSIVLKVSYRSGSIASNCGTSKW